MMAVSAVPPKRPAFQRRPSVMRKLKSRRARNCTMAPNTKAMGTLRKMPRMTSSAFEVFM